MAKSLILCLASISVSGKCSINDGGMRASIKTQFLIFTNQTGKSLNYIGLTSLRKKYGEETSNSAMLLRRRSQRISLLGTELGGSRSEAQFSVYQNHLADC